MAEFSDTPVDDGRSAGELVINDVPIRRSFKGSYFSNSLLRSDDLVRTPAIDDNDAYSMSSRSTDDDDRRRSTGDGDSCRSQYTDNRSIVETSVVVAPTTIKTSPVVLEKPMPEKVIVDASSTVDGDSTDDSDRSSTVEEKPIPQTPARTKAVDSGRHPKRVKSDSDRRTRIPNDQCKESKLQEWGKIGLAFLAGLFVGNQFIAATSKTVQSGYF